MKLPKKEVLNLDRKVFINIKMSKKKSWRHNYGHHKHLKTISFEGQLYSTALRYEEKLKIFSLKRVEWERKLAADTD